MSQPETDHSELPMETPGSFIRWQMITLQQLGYAINLILAFAVAALAFQFNLLMGSQQQPSCAIAYALLVSLGLLAFSFILGLMAVINRLNDFRTTARTARAREKKRRDELARHRATAEALGERTWVLFWAQVATFGLGIVIGAGALAALTIQRML